MASAASSEQVVKRARFRWNDDRIHHLLLCLQNFKSEMEYKNRDFNADKVAQYENVRQGLAKIFIEQLSYFGPPFVSNEASQVRDPFKDLSEQQKYENNLIKTGYTRVREKIKEIRQNFSTAVTTGRRSGSGRVVQEFFDILVEIYGGSPAVESLPFGADTVEMNNDSFIDQHELNVTSSTSLVSDSYEDNDISDTNRTDCSNFSSVDMLPDTSDDDENHDVRKRKRVVEEIQNCSKEATSSKVPGVNNKKRKITVANDNPVPKLIDNKRKHMERQLSAAQRDQLLLKEAKDDAVFKKDMAEAIKQSNKTFAQSMELMSNSIMQVAQGLNRSLEMIGQVLISNTDNFNNSFSQNQSYPGYMQPRQYTHPFDYSHSSRSNTHNNQNIEITDNVQSYVAMLSDTKNDQGSYSVLPKKK